MKLSLIFPAMKLSNKQINRLQFEIRELLNEWDFIGVMNDPKWPRDEYDPLRDRLINELIREPSVDTIAEFLKNDIKNNFGLNPKDSDIVLFAEKAANLFNQNYKTTEAEGAS